MKLALPKIKSKKGVSHYVYILLNLILPILVFVFIRIEFAHLAVAVILLSKWRMFAVRPRYWFANIRANAVDIIVALSIVIFMQSSQTQSWQLIWMALYGGWLIWIKPLSKVGAVSLQALIAQTVGISALVLLTREGSLLWLVLGAWGIGYATVRHFLTAYDEPHVRTVALTWGYVTASLAWILGHWQLYYLGIPQLTVITSVISYAAAAMYYLTHVEKLSVGLKRNFVLLTSALLVIILLLSDWQYKGL